MSARYPEGRQRGVTMMELLVTIIVAGIAFAALVPVFVYAQKTGSGDKARIVAMNVAQSKVELMRDLPYQLVTQEFLNGDSPAAQDAGIRTTWTSADGKVYDIAYTVTKVVRERVDSEWVLTEYPTADGHDVPDGDESFKMVTVDVVWRGPPVPSRRAILKTAVYRRFAGPEVSRLTVSPLSLLPSGRVGIYAPNGPVWMTAELSLYDWSDTSFVTFTVEGPNGQPVFEQAVPVDAAQPQVPVGCQWQWSERPTDGMYKFIAVATNLRNEEGNEWTLWYPLDTGPPPAPANVVVIRGRAAAIVQWERPDASDITGYEAQRNPVTGGSASDSAATWSDLPIWTLAPKSEGVEFPAALVDRSVTPDSAYEYLTRARDLQGVGEYSVPGSLEPLPQESGLRSDSTPPNSPGRPILTAYGQAVEVSWTAPRPLGDVAYYCVYRDDEWDAPLAVVPVSDALTITDQRAGWSQTHSYTVVSMDAALNESARGASASISIPEAPVGQEFKLTVKVSGYSAQATVESLADYLSYPLSDNGNSQNLQYVAFLNANQKKTFSGLPYGMYRVRVRFDGPVSVPESERLFVRDIELYEDRTLEFSVGG